MIIHSIEIDGNDGTGKSTLCHIISSWGIRARNRGIISKISLGQATVQDLRDDVLYVILDLPPKISQKRLSQAGKDLTEEYHTLPSLCKFRSIYCNIYRQVNRPNVLLLSANQPVQDVLNELFESILDSLPFSKLGEKLKKVKMSNRHD